LEHRTRIRHAADTPTNRWNITWNKIKKSTHDILPFSTTTTTSREI
jgi:hypothetical protein